MLLVVVVVVVVVELELSVGEPEVEVVVVVPLAAPVYAPERRSQLFKVTLPPVADVAKLNTPYR